MPEVTIELLDAKSQIIESRMDARVAAINATIDARVESMNVKIDATRTSLEAKLDSRCAAIESHCTSIETKIDAALVRMEERDETRRLWEQGRDKYYETRLSNFEDVHRGTMAAIGNLKNTTVVTAIASVLAIVLGVAGFNAALLSNMQTSFQTGRDLGASLMQASSELKQMSEQLAMDRRATRQMAPPLK
jgi:hypothetical protein